LTWPQHYGTAAPWRSAPGCGTVKIFWKRRATKVHAVSGREALVEKSIQNRGLPAAAAYQKVDRTSLQSIGCV
jgi:hypothetical protein